jgi:outer membrane cobalamin receptor
VVVTATKTEIAISDAPQSISVITAEEILRSPDRSIAEVMQRVPGVVINQVGPMGGLNTASIRGSESGQVLILLNGRRLNNYQNGQFDLNNLPVSKEEIERIEVLRGGASALYGADALGGVINIITKTPSKKPETYGSASYGRFNTQQYSLTHRWKPGALSYGFSLVEEQSGGYRENSDYRKWALGGELGYEFLPQNEITVSARTVQKKIGLPGTLMYPDPDDNQKDGDTFLDLAYQGKVTPRLNLNVRGFHNAYRNFFDPGTRGFYSMGSSVALHKSNATGGELQGTYALGENHLLTSGFEAIEDRLNSATVGVQRATRGAFYLQDEMEVLPPLTTTLGFRYDTHSIYSNQFNPRLGLVYRLPAEIRLRGSIGRSYRAPTFNDLYWPADSYTAGNPNLKPEVAWAYELGGEKKFGTFVLFKAAGFYREVKDLINWAAGPDWVWRPTNINSAKIWGTEVELSFYPFRGLSIPLNYAYLYPRDENTGGPIPSKAKHIVNVGVEYAILGFKPSLKGRYVQYYLNQTTPLNRDYFVLDARLGYEFTIDPSLKGEAFLSMTNALNRQYQVSEGYPMPPQSLNGGVSLSF